MKKIIILLILSITSTLCFRSFAQTGANWRIIESSGYDSEDVGVAAFTDADNTLIDKTGTNDSRAGIQELLDRLGAAGGGTLYLSAGKYRVSSLLVIPKGVVLRGDWKKPQKDAPLEGTVLMAYYGRGTQTESNAFITMEPSTGLYNIAVWYPDQTPDNITAYPPTVLYGRKNVWGNDYCNVRNVTLVNSYSGVVLSIDNGGGCPNIFNLYGSPLSRGIEIDRIADVGRFDWIDFSPDYWAASGLPGAPAKDGAHKSYIRNNATGVVMRRNDWSYTCHLSVEGYKTGFYAGHTQYPENSSPNGHNYHLTFKDCAEAIRIDEISDAGMMFAKVKITDCDQGIVIGETANSTAQFYDFEISAQQNAIKIEEKASLKLMTQQGKIYTGKISILGGIYTSVDGDFYNETPQVSTGIGGRLLLSGNRFAKPVEISDHSLFKSAIDHKQVSIKPLPEFPEIKPRETKPRNALYLVTSAEFGGKNDAVTDNTSAIQNALNKAGNEGGGIVFLPPGKYKVLGNLTVPAGVELKGASDVASVPKGQGSILEVYAGKNNPAGTPFLTLEGNSGIRGITFNYPEQKSSFTLPSATLPQYPYCIRVAGPNVYIVNVGVRATYYGIDLFTHQCDNHYVDYFAGHVFKNAMRIGGESSNGIISNTQFNTLIMSNGYENPKFGGWPNSENDQATRDAVYNQNWKELEFMILEDCKNQILYNNFHYGSHQGIVFGKNGTAPSGISMGLGLDASLRSICYEGLDANKGFDLINTQAVSVARDLYADTKYLETSPGFTGNAYLYNSDYWGNARYAGVFGGGTVNLLMPHFQQYGGTRFLEITGNANVNISTSDVNATNFVSGGKAGQVSVESSVVALSSPTGYRSWWNNLSTSPAIQPQTTLPRTGWTAMGYNSSGISSGIGNYALNGDATLRWTAGSQVTPGQHLIVDTKQTTTQFNTVILDTSPSPNDWPSAYAIYVSNDNVNWGEPVVTGSQPSAVAIIRLPKEITARYVKVVQTGSGKTLYWSVYEFYLANIDYTSIGKIAIDKQKLHLYLERKTAYISGNEQISPNAQVKIYNSAGQNVMTAGFSANGISLQHLPAGIYIVVLQNGNSATSWKIVIR